MFKVVNRVYQDITCEKGGQHALDVKYMVLNRNLFLNLENIWPYYWQKTSDFRQQ